MEYCLRLEKKKKNYKRDKLEKGVVSKNEFVSYDIKILGKIEKKFHLSIYISRNLNDFLYLHSNNYRENGWSVNQRT